MPTTLHTLVKLVKLVKLPRLTCEGGGGVAFATRRACVGWVSTGHPPFVRR
jgi:hypothetical protein